MAANTQAVPSSFGSSQLVKREKDGQGSANGALIHGSTSFSGQPPPIRELTGHTGEVYAIRFDPTGEHLASGSMDRTIMLWHTSGTCDNYGVLSGHKGAVLDLRWSRDTRTLFSASADAMLASWDTVTGERIRRYIGHEDVINSMDASTRGIELLASASDDGYIGLWDERQKHAIDFIETDYPVTAVALAEAGNELYYGGIDNEIKVWDTRKRKVIYTLKGHADTITSLQVSPDTHYLLSNAMDSTLRTWDIRPFAPDDRHVKSFDGAPSGMEKNLLRASWDSNGQRIISGSGDRTVVIWETRTGKLLHKLPGHRGAVNDARFQPVVAGQSIASDIVVSGSSDHNIIIGDLRPKTSTQGSAEPSRATQAI